MMVHCSVHEAFDAYFDLNIADPWGVADPGVLLQVSWIPGLAGLLGAWNGSL